MAWVSCRRKDELHSNTLISSQWDNNGTLETVYANHYTFTDFYLDTANEVLVAVLGQKSYTWRGAALEEASSYEPLVPPWFSTFSVINRVLLRSDAESNDNNLTQLEVFEELGKPIFKTS